MRPPKQIAIVGGGYGEAGMLAFALNLHTDFCAMDMSAAAAIQVIPDIDVRLVIVLWPLAGTQQFLDAVWEMPQDINTLILAGAGDTVDCIADSVLFGANTAAIIDRVHMLTQRKRGPKKKPPRNEAQAAARLGESSVGALGNFS